jgi:hypothetical protein
MPSRLFALIAMLCLSAALHAQSEAHARYQLYGGYSYLSNSLDGLPGSQHGLNGFDAALAIPPWHNLRFRVDVSGYFGTNLGAPQHPYFILGGGQYSWRIRRESLFIEGLAGTGGANKTWAPNGAIGQTASFASVVGGGLDTPLTPRFAFRVEGGYQYSYFILTTASSSNIPYSISGLPRNFGRLSTGIVWNF